MDIFDLAKARTNLKDVVLGLTTLNKYNQGPCPICGGTDRFYVRYENLAICSPGDGHCGFKGDQIALIAKVHSISLLEAAEHLAGVSRKELPKTVRVHAPQKKAPAKIVREWQSESWQSEARAIIEAGVSRLLLEGYHDKETLNGYHGQYLRRRKVHPNTAQAFKLGYDPELFDPATKSKRPAIVIPWISSGGIITAIKYRFIDDLAQDKGRRFSQKKGSESLLFGLNACSKSLEPRGVVIVEGEFNAMAIVQAVWYSQMYSHDYGPDGVGGKVIVLSVGSQGNSKGLEMARKYCEKYRRVNVMLWFDEEKQVKEAFKVFPKGIGVKSLNGLDANDILRRASGHDDLNRYVLSRFTEREESEVVVLA